MNVIGADPADAAQTSCQCKTGFEDQNGGTDSANPTCRNKNECLAMVCNSLAKCDDLDPGILAGEPFSCTCPEGFTGDGVFHCSDINECADDTHNCGFQTQVTNMAIIYGSWTRHYGRIHKYMY